jgi:hypothetical protein
MFWYILIPYLNRHFNIAVSETIRVNMCMFKQKLNISIFMITQLINMNIGLREYPVEGRVTESPDFPLSLIVSDLNRCSRTNSMQADAHDFLLSLIVSVLNRCSRTNSMQADVCDFPLSLIVSDLNRCSRTNSM